MIFHTQYRKNQKWPLQYMLEEIMLNDSQVMTNGLICRKAESRYHLKFG